MPAAERADAETLTTRLGHRFTEPALLDQALTHTSATGGRGGARASYERLEFLGDRVLGLIVAELLFDAFPNEREGALGRRHAGLVNRDTLAAVARQLDLGADIVLSRGEADSGGRDNPAILADACEAVIGALYRDGGLDAARAFVEHHWRPLLAHAEGPPKDAKTALQEWALARGLPLPSYEIAAREGPDHAPRFTVAATVSGHAPVHGTGRAKREAEHEAARRLLAALTGEGAP